MQFTISLKSIFSCCFELLEKEQIQNFNKTPHKNRKTNLNKLFLNYLMSYIAHQCFIWSISISIYFFLFHQRGPKKSHTILVLLSQGWNALPGACSDIDLYFLPFLSVAGEGGDPKRQLRCPWTRLSKAHLPWK